MVTTVHDSVLVCVPVDHVSEVATKMKGVMQRPFDCVRPEFYIPVEIEAGGPGEPWSKLLPWRGDVIHTSGR